MNNEQMQAAMKELRDAMVVMAHMEARQTERLLRQEQEIERLAEAEMLVRQKVRRLDEESPQFRRRTEQNLAEITYKLNGLIGHIEGQFPSTGPQ